jgi:hypothetical protein
MATIHTVAMMKITPNNNINSNPETLGIRKRRVGLSLITEIKQTEADISPAVVQKPTSQLNVTKLRILRISVITTTKTPQMMEADRYETHQADKKFSPPNFI